MTTRDGFDLTYGTYLNLDRILSAQNPPGLDGEPRELHHHEEMLFVVIHQVYELWFKQIIHDLVLARDLLARDSVPETDIPRVSKGLRRVHEIQRILVEQISVLETMNPADFLAFRGELGAASGFQSAQFREFEILATNSLDGYTLSTPAVSQGHIYIRAGARLYAITEGG